MKKMLLLLAAVFTLFSCSSIESRIEDFKSEDPEERQEAVLAIGSSLRRGEIDDPKDAAKALDLICAAAEDPSHLVRSAAIVRLGRLAKKETLPVMLKALSDSHFIVRSDAILALTSFPEECEDSLISLLQKDGSEHVRRMAAASLGNMKRKKAVEPLIAAMEKDNCEAVQFAVYESLKTITGKDMGRSPFEWRAWLDSPSK